MKNNQKGITFLSFVIILAVLGFFGYIAMRLFPVYVQFYSANNDIKAITQSSGASTRSIQDIRAELDRRFNISYVDTIDLNKDIKIVTNNDQKQLQLKYEIRRPLLYNLDFVAKFDKLYSLSSQKGIE